MKRIIALVLALVMCFVLCACGTGEKKEEKAEQVFKDGAYGRLGKFIYENGEQDGAEYVYASDKFSMHLAQNGEITWKYEGGSEESGISMTLEEKDMQLVVFTDTYIEDGSKVYYKGNFTKSEYDPEFDWRSELFGFIMEGRVDSAYAVGAQALLEGYTRKLIASAKEVVEEAGLTMVELGFENMDD